MCPSTLPHTHPPLLSNQFFLIFLVHLKLMNDPPTPTPRPHRLYFTIYEPQCFNRKQPPLGQTIDSHYSPDLSTMPRWSSKQENCPLINSSGFKHGAKCPLVPERMSAAQLLSCCRWPSVENGWYFIKLLISTKIRIRSWHTGLGHLSCWSWFVGILILFKMYRIKCSVAVLQSMGEIWVYNQSVCQSLMPSIICTVNMVELEKELRLVTS